MSEPYGTVRWFGPTWGAPVNDPANEIPTPFGEECAQCGLKIRDERERGLTLPYSHDGVVERIVYHHLCFLEAVGIPEVT